MKLKKKIIRQSFDYKAEKDYYREAKVCPNCGLREEFGSDCEAMLAELHGHAKIREGRIENGDSWYECRNCGCQWEVRLFKG